MLKTDYLIANIGVDTAENEPSKVATSAWIFGHAAAREEAEATQAAAVLAARQEADEQHRQELAAAEKRHAETLAMAVRAARRV